MSLDELKDGTKDQDLDSEYQLTDEQVSSLHEKSWALLPGLLNEETVEKVRASLLAAAPRTTISGPSKTPVDPEALLSLSHEGVAWQDPYLRSVATSRRLASAVVGLLKQRDAIFCQDISFLKPVGGRVTSFHQDYSYWPFDRKGCVSLWIALTDMSENMGPLRYLEGSHHEGPLGYIEPGDIRDRYPQLQERKIVGGKALKAGDAQAHWELTIHGSGANDGEGRREAVAFRYIRSDTIYTGLTHPHYDTFNLTPGEKFAESDALPRIGPEGLIEA